MDSLPLKDIEGISALAWWPPAPGWVVMAGCLCLIAMAFMWKRARKHKRIICVVPPRDASLYSRAVILAENARRYALVHGDRHKVAGLRGEEWLMWLREKDNNRFSWDMHALWLNDVGYAPEETVCLSEQEVAAAEFALRRMVKAG